MIEVNDMTDRQATPPSKGLDIAPLLVPYYHGQSIHSRKFETISGRTIALPPPPPHFQINVMWVGSKECCTAVAADKNWSNFSRLQNKMTLNCIH